VKQAQPEAPDSEVSKVEEGTQQLREPLLTRSSTRQRITLSAADLEVEESRKQENLQRKVLRAAGGEKDKKPEQDILKTDGFAQMLKRSRTFNLICFAVISWNAIWVSIHLDNALAFKSHPSLISILTDNAICGWFSFELVVWILAFRRPRSAFSYGFVTHATIVVLMVWSLWVEPLLQLPGLISSRNAKYLSFLTVMRLSNLAKVAHLLDDSPEMDLYTAGILKGIQSIIPLLTLFSLLVYVFAVAFRWLLSDTYHAFATVPKTFHFLFLSAFASVDKNFFNAMLEKGWLPWGLFVVYTLVGNLTVAKMLTGVLLQVVQKLVQKEKEKTDTIILEETIEKVARQLDVDGGGSLSKAEFEELMANNALLETMANHHVDVAGFIDFTLFYFPKDDKLFVPDLIRSAKQFCGFKPASVMDMMNLRKLIYLEMDVLSKGQAQIHEDLQALTNRRGTSQERFFRESGTSQERLLSGDFNQKIMALQKVARSL